MLIEGMFTRGTHPIGPKQTITEKNRDRFALPKISNRGVVDLITPTHPSQRRKQQQPQVLLHLAVYTPRANLHVGRALRDGG